MLVENLDKKNYLKITGMILVDSADKIKQAYGKILQDEDLQCRQSIKQRINQ